MFMREKLISCFQNTLETSTHILEKETKQSVKTNMVYKEGFISCKCKGKENSSIIVESNTTFAAARKYIRLGKVAVLNFANPEHPGGGVQNGAMAQEECLCRSSNLYACISAQNVFNDYYQYHRELRNPFYSDRLIYTKNVIVFKDDSAIPMLLPKEEWFAVDVVTCAAPYLAKRKYTNTEALLRLFKGRIKNILEAARDNEVDIIILGAFGCGAFKNPPLIVAQAFEEIIREENYRGDFKQIVFAIKPTGENCPNVSVFSSTFDMYAPDAGERAVLLSAPSSFRFHKNPRIEAFTHTSERKFERWQSTNKYFGKQFSVLGDSISTLEGYNPKGYKVFYAEENCERSGVIEMQDTWWDKVISFFGGELLVNNSWSGSRVTKLTTNDSLFPSGCSNERTSSLHIDSVHPDVIIVYLGTNDWAFGANQGDETRVLDDDENEYFSIAYDNMLRKIRNNYPDADIWCCTLSETYMSSKPSFKFPHKYAGTHIEVYNNIIRDIVFKNKCRLIDLYSFHIPYDAVDGSHPTKNGMNTIAVEVIRSVAGNEVDAFLDCENDLHQYEIVEEYTGGTRHICKKCAKEKYTSNLPPKQEAVMNTAETKKDDSEYVLLDPNITTMLYSNTLKLTSVSSGKVIQFMKDVVTVGKEPTRDLFIDKYKTISRHHATFFYENEMWFLRDDNSTNGTWINGARLEAGKKYQLTTNDEINFAMSERYVFYEHKVQQMPMGDEDAKAIVYLEAGISTFVKSGHKDDVAFKLIISSLTKAPLYFPVEIDLEAMLGGVDPTTLKPGDTLQPNKDVKIKFLTVTLNDGEEAVAAFTSKEEMEKGQSVSVVRHYPVDYLPMLAKMNKQFIINPFSESNIVLKQSAITDILLPIIEESQKADQNAGFNDSDNMIGKVIEDKYELLKVLGKGGTFTVYLAMDKKLNKQWAVKVCKKNAKNPVVIDMAMQEVNMMKRFDCPSIPKIIDLAEDSEHIYIVQEYVFGETLDSILKKNGPMPEEAAVVMAKQLCKTLGYLHKLNPPYIYRDMKPGNVLVQPDGNIKLIDFGTAMVYDSLKDRDDCILGTKGYAAPEQFIGKSDPRSDIYALGITMHQMVTGVAPNEPPYETKPIRQINPRLSRGLEAIIIRCIQNDLRERYQNCDELLNDLNNYLNPQKPKGIFNKLFGKK